MAVTAIRTVILYVGLIAAFRVTGKRQIGQLQPLELVVTLMIADLAVVPMQQSDAPLAGGLIPIAVLVALELILSALMLKSNGLSRLVSGNPVVVVRDGEPDQTALRRLRLSMEELTEVLRGQGVFDLHEVRVALAEPSGSISVYRTAATQTATRADVLPHVPERGMPVPVLYDGQSSAWGMALAGVDEAWITDTLHARGLRRRQVLLLTVDGRRRVQVVEKQQRKGNASCNG